MSDRESGSSCASQFSLGCGPPHLCRLAYLSRRTLYGCDDSGANHPWRKLRDHSPLQIRPVEGEGTLPADGGWEGSDYVAMAGGVEYDARPVADRGPV